MKILMSVFIFFAWVFIISILYHALHDQAGSAPAVDQVVGGVSDANATRMYRCVDNGPLTIEIRKDGTHVFQCETGFTLSGPAD